MMDRRTFLRGLGTTMALPMMESMLPLTALAQTPKTAPVRMAFVFVPNGINMGHWTPSTEGAAFELPTILEPLAKVRNNVSILTGLAQHNAAAFQDGPGDHARSTATWLTGVHIKKTAGADIKAGISVDQLAARELAKKTRFASLEIGCERGAQAGDCDSGYSCAYSSSIAWRGESTPVAKETNPRLVFERLFGSGGDAQLESRLMRDRYRKSILDFVLEDASRISNQLGGRDKQKLDEYLSGVREIEERLARFEKENPAAFVVGTKKPPGVPADFEEHLKLMADMLVLAFQTDLTRVSTFMFANDGSNRAYPMIGFGDGHHDVSHHGNDPGKLEKKRQIDLFHARQLAYLLERMESIREPTGTLLDNSMIVYGAGISDGNAHNHDNLPILLAGKGGGTIKQGRHIRYAPNTPMNNLFLSMLDRVGVPAEKIGDSTGKLAQLF